MTDLLAEFGKKLVDRWFTLLVLPGALFVAVTAVARVLGWSHAFDVALAHRHVDAWVGAARAGTGAGLVAALLALLTAAAAAGVAAQGIGSAAERAALAADWSAWPRPARWLARTLTQARRTRWDTADKGFREAEYGKAKALARLRVLAAPTAEARALVVSASDELATRAGARDRIARGRPRRPTWSGDRVEAAAVRLDEDLGIDVSAVWPALWLTLPKSERDEVSATRESLTRAAVLGGWGVLYLLPAILWWPAIVIPVGIAFSARARFRTAVDAYATLVETVAILHAAELAKRFGLDHTEPLDPEVGRRLSILLSGPRSLLPLMGPPPTPGP